MNELIDEDQEKSDQPDLKDHSQLDASVNEDGMVSIPLDKRHNTEDYPDSPTKSIQEEKRDSEGAKPKFDISMVKMDSHRLQLPEESKDPFERKSSKLKIDFSNDPVMKALMETKQDQ